MFGASKSTTATSPGKRGAFSAIGADVTITGDVAYDSIAIETGARIDGKMRHRNGHTSEEPLWLVDASDEAA